MGELGMVRDRWWIVIGEDAKLTRIELLFVTLL